MCINSVTPLTLKGNILMLKLSIPATILTAVSTSVATLLTGVITTEKNNLKLNAIHKIRDKSMAKAFGVPVEEYVKNKEEKRAKYLSNLLSKLTLSEIKPITTKIGSVSVVGETVEIAINDQYIVDCIEASTRVGLRMLKPLSDIAVIVEEEGDKTEAMLKTWEEDKVEVSPTEPEIEMEIKIVDASDVPSEIVSGVLKKEQSKDNYIFNGWSVKTSTLSSKPFYTDEKREQWIDLYYLTFTNKEGNSLSVGQTQGKSILSSKLSIKDTAEEQELPESLVLAVYEYYGFKPVEDKTE